MDYYAKSALWVRLDSLVRNRVKVINAVTEDRAEYRTRGGVCSVLFLGRELCEYRAYDLEQTRRAVDCLESVYKVLWDCRREGLATFV